MTILNTISLESNRNIKINFNGGDLSSDGGLLLIKEFAARIGLIKLVKKLFKTTDPALYRIHTDSDNLMHLHPLTFMKPVRKMIVNMPSV